MSILDKYLKKIGVKSSLDLTEEERRTYDMWSSALSGRKLTDVDVNDFLDRELDEAVGKLTNTSITDREDTFLKMKVDFIRRVKIFLQSPELERKIVENQIQSQL